MSRDKIYFSKRIKYEPWYDDRADYNTNAKSYYDYLARFNKFISEMVDFINKLADRDLTTSETNSIEFVKEYDWQKPDDIITLLANVKISNSTETKEMDNLTPKSYTIGNGSTIKSNGLWSPDYAPILESMNEEIGRLQDTNNNLQEEINNLKDEVNVLRGGLQKILTNLHDSGAITTNNVSTYAFVNGRNIATGNINLFGGTADGNSFIRTNSGKTNNDITAGY